MSSDTIKQMAARILSNIRNQYPNSYEDSSRKELLVKTILSKIDKYSKHINQKTINNIIDQIYSEIVAEFHPPKKTKVAFPQKPKNSVQFNDNYMLNPDYDDNTSTMSRVQFERNNLNGGRPVGMSQRPQTSKPQQRNKNPNTNPHQNQTQLNNAFIPITRQYEDFQNDMHIGVPSHRYQEEEDDDAGLENRYERLMQERQRDFANVNQRPPTPDFSLDGSGKKKKEEDRRRQQQMQQNSNSQYQQNPQAQYQQNPQTQSQHNMSNLSNTTNNFAHNPQAQFGIIGLNELPQNSSGFSSFDNHNDDFSNINNMNTGVNPHDVKFNDNVSVDARLRQIQSMRDDIQIDRSQGLPPSVNTSVRSNNDQNQSSNHPNQPPNQPPKQTPNQSQPQLNYQPY